MGIGLGLFESAVRAKKSAPAGDTTAPAQVTDLAVVANGLDDATLSWSASGDDGITGVAAEFDLRMALATISNETAWNNATSYLGGWQANATAPGGYAEQYILNPNIGVNTYWSVRYRDEAGNMGPISNIVLLQWL